MPAGCLLGTSENHGNSCISYMPPQKEDLTLMVKILPLMRYAYKTSKTGGFRMVPGGSRQHGCRAGHALECRALPCRPIRWELKKVKKTLFEACCSKSMQMVGLAGLRQLCTGDTGNCQPCVDGPKKHAKTPRIPSQNRAKTT